MISKKINNLKELINYNDKQKRINEIYKLIEAPNFYSNIDSANKILKELKSLEIINHINSIEQEYNDLLEISEILSPEEIEQANFKIIKSLDKIELESKFTGPYDHNNAILTLHAGAGGTEAQDWCNILFRMYSRWAEKKGFKLEVFDSLSGDTAGIKSVTFQISGENAYGLAKNEKGVHRLVRISPFDAAGRRHTSFAALEVMPEISDEVNIDISPEDLRIDTYRSSGAGGQHINKTESAVRITHLPTGVVVACQTERSQHQNKDTAMKILKSKLIEIAQEQHKETIAEIQGEQMDNGWGSQIRSYVFHPYSMVKDHRTNYETGNIQAVIDGDLDSFIEAALINL